MNDPPVGLVTPETDRDAGRKTCAHDPHLDPQLSWAGKAEHTSYFRFDPDATEDIDEIHWPDLTLLKAQMNADLLTDDLKKKRAGNEGFRRVCPRN